MHTSSIFVKLFTQKSHISREHFPSQYCKLYLFILYFPCHICHQRKPIMLNISASPTCYVTQLKPKVIGSWVKHDLNHTHIVFTKINPEAKFHHPL